ncbi:hypothetical protein EJ05DRAFT_502117 [Pseudovirgaria hyperparasitica]|uniref:Uncharacterized protein n=1 Tax=Pseudovirgaria hyperparasitica TaxID=470096 RepID=A0A6A6W3V6_9PEZI|nr:uncharacterized protein EJ05DRAFT_502117 [Pseudovirgaria hyperparasitica]KAF2756620.1 hypothetical protein EJ05DRAFT_502117 [Pseudovirgaria hyperparasitica]
MVSSKDSDIKSLPDKATQADKDLAYKVAANIKPGHKSGESNIKETIESAATKEENLISKRTVGGDDGGESGTAERRV